MIGLASWLVLGMLGAAPEATAAPGKTAVVVLPLLADGSVSVKQARGITALVRSAIKDGDVGRVLSESGDDDKQAQKCQRDLACLGGVADLRGADLVLSGTVSTAPDGLKVSVVVVKPHAKEALRRAEATLQGNDGDAARLDRLARQAVDPHSLQGSIRVVGDEGATVELDGRAIGALPLDDEIQELPEGDHELVVRKAGYQDLHRMVTVVHRQSTEVKAVLLGGTATTSAPHPVDADGPPSHTDAIVVGTIGGGLLVLGAVAGALSLKDALDVEARAKVQQLAFPQNSDLLLRGQALAWTADGLYLGGVVAGAAAVALWVLETPPDAAAAP